MTEASGVTFAAEGGMALSSSSEAALECRVGADGVDAGSCAAHRGIATKKHASKAERILRIPPMGELGFEHRIQPGTAGSANYLRAAESCKFLRLDIIHPASENHETLPQVIPF